LECVKHWIKRAMERALLGAFAQSKTT